MLNAYGGHPQEHIGCFIEEKCLLEHFIIQQRVALWELMTSNPVLNLCTQILLTYLVSQHGSQHASQRPNA